MINEMSLLIQVPAHTTMMSKVTSNISLCNSHSFPSLRCLEPTTFWGKAGSEVLPVVGTALL